MSTLRDALGEVAYNELVEMVTPKQPEWLAWLKGSIKSWTIRAGAILLALPSLIEYIHESAPQLQGDLISMFGEPMVSSAFRIIGILTILLRFKTTKPLKERST